MQELTYFKLAKRIPKKSDQLNIVIIKQQFNFGINVEGIKQNAKRYFSGSIKLIDCNFNIL